MSERYLTLAQHGIRLLRQQDPQLLPREPYKTSRLELDAALAWLQTLQPATPRQAPALSAADIDLAAKYQGKLRDEMARHTEYLAGGKATDWADYKRVAGMIASLRTALNTYGELLKGNED